LCVVEGEIRETGIRVDTKSVPFQDTPDNRVAKELVTGVADCRCLEVVFACEGSNDEFWPKFHAPGELAFGVEGERVG
jgi:hypothetical protein